MDKEKEKLLDDDKEETFEAEIVEEEAEQDSSESKTNSDENQIDEYKDKYQRLLADFSNYKQREEKNKVEFKKYAIEGLVEKMLPVLDSFDRALENVDKDDSFVKGIKLTRDEFWKILSNEGLEEIESDNVKFDPTLHQAVLAEDCEGVESGFVSETFQKGYKIGNKVIRPAMVKVAN
ncbi:MAG: nucleotide exchange factor GrpE [Peptoniphilaceae bacterium]|nr:nucleotide exchange factor GrpE [Peptoniphilaceae bacterium]